MDGQPTYHLMLTIFTSPNHYPLYNSRSLNRHGWLEDMKRNNFLWFPHDSRDPERQWGSSKIFVTGDSRGIIIAVDFSDIHDFEMYGPAIIWYNQEKRVTEYVKKLQAIPWHNIVSAMFLVHHANCLGMFQAATSSTYLDYEDKFSD